MEGPCLRSRGVHARLRKISDLTNVSSPDPPISDVSLSWRVPETSGSSVHAAACLRVLGRVRINRTMARLTARDRQRYEYARQRGRQHALRATAVLRARYNVWRDALELRFRSGGVRVIPRSLLPELDSVPTATVRSVTVSPSGDAISWRALDVDVSVRGLLRRGRQSAQVDFNARGRQTT